MNGVAAADTPKIVHVAMRVENVDTASRFYLDILGMRELARVNDSVGPM